MMNDKMTKGSMRSENRIQLRQIFLGLQMQMRSKLALNKKVLSHPVAKGDATEIEWIDFLSTYLPARYRVEKAFVIDHVGQVSEQIDIVIFDRFYSPFLFRQNGQTYIPAESVYAVIEAKSQLSRVNLKYAANKASSVRRLRRTSAPIVDRGVQRAPRTLTHIFAGIVTIDGRFTRTHTKILRLLNNNQHLDIGCSLEGNSFYIDPQDDGHVEIGDPINSLVFFFTRLLQGLQSVGTVQPMQIDKYARELKYKSIDY